MIIYPSEKALSLFDQSVRTYIVFFGEWSGLIYSKEVLYTSFQGHVWGYLVILAMLVVEKKSLDWLEIRSKRKQVSATMYAVVKEEVKGK